MKLAFVLISILFIGSVPLFAQTADNAEILHMFDADQSARKVASIDWNQLNKDDALRRKRVDELLDSGKVVTGKDYFHSAMIFQHGTDTLASAKAIKLMKKAIELDPTTNNWLLAAAIDRHLMRKGQPQIYGTQYVKMGPNAKFERYRIDSTKVTDEERKAYHVETLAEQRLKERRMNQLRLSQFYADKKSVDETIALIQSESKKGSNALYDVTEPAVNSFGYELFKTDAALALPIFKLNTELNPNGFNAFDSYGECLLKVGLKEEAISAYRKSLLLNPKNTNAEKVLKTLGASR